MIKFNHTNYTACAREIYNEYAKGYSFTKNSLAKDVMREYSKMNDSESIIIKQLKKAISSYTYRLEKTGQIKRIKVIGQSGVEIWFAKELDDKMHRIYQKSNISEIIQSKKKLKMIEENAVEKMNIFEQNFNAEQVGIAILKVVTVLQARISKREEKITGLNAELKVLTETNVSIHRDLRNAQDKLLRISKKIQLNNGATLNLSKILKNSG